MLSRVADEPAPLVMFHDYHLYTCPGLVREARPDAVLQHFVHIPWSQPDSWRILPAVWREEIYRGLLANDIIGFHTTAYCRNLLHCCRELLELEVDYERGRSCTRAARPGSAPTRWDRRRPARSGRGRLARGRRCTSASCCGAGATT